ncbi:hypothetical protein FACS189427_11350 [Planctomycetales bacterium]|nr:hypothetical protein FACS189427_11350 [Planctomycetales bacterium]
MKGSYAVDLFGGTGALAIEAISRGAVGAAVIEIHLPTAALLRQNIDSLNLLNKCRLYKTDAFFWVQNTAEHPPKDVPWLVFCSPPYSFYIDRQEEMLKMLGSIYQEAPDNSVFALEFDKRFSEKISGEGIFDTEILDTGILPFSLSSARIREYPPAVVAVFSK